MNNEQLQKLGEKVYNNLKKIAPLGGVARGKKMTLKQRQKHPLKMVTARIAKENKERITKNFSNNTEQ